MNSVRPRPLVIFRQGGNNVRLGNTLVWICSAHEWAMRHGFDFCFPGAARVLGALLDAGSPLLSWPSSADEWLQSDAASFVDDRHQYPELLEKLAIGHIRLATQLRSASMPGQAVSKCVSLDSGGVCCIVDARGLDWDGRSVVEFIGNHRLCVIEEPHPFSTAVPVPPARTKELLPPSTMSRNLLHASPIGPGMTIGLHVRQTDYRRWRGGELFRDNAFYNGIARSVLNSSLGELKLIVAHDGEFVPDDVLSSDTRLELSSGGPGDVTRDFVRFACCDLLIGPWSTFTVQASKLGAIWAPKARRIVQLTPDSDENQLVAAARSAMVSLRPGLS